MIVLVIADYFTNNTLIYQYIMVSISETAAERSIDRKGKRKQ